MPLTAGQRLGAFEILGALGAGGMGEVYKARDTRLNRTVAIKVLPAALAGDPEFRARFNREAKSISALNHPHICTLYDVGDVDGMAYLVMEHLEGETLADRLKKGPVPIDQGLEIAGQIADALDKAHRQGIVHRDLKPANIFLVRGGSASTAPLSKLLDFGLAKAGAAATPGSIETRLMTSPADGQAPLTSHGSILGTFQYMAPEQIEGHEADARTDIWAFGCVVYEMLTGRRAFEGRSQASLIASILERQPQAMTEFQPMTPPALGRVVRTCLEKDPDHRFHSAHDLWLQLQWIKEGGSAGPPAPVVAGRRRRNLVALGAAALVIATLAAVAAWALKPAPVTRDLVTRFEYRLPSDQRLTRTGRRTIAISPDGTKLAFVANNQLYLKLMHELEARPIRGTDVDPVEPMFSPDGESLAFLAPTERGAGLEGAVLKRVAITGGALVTIWPAGSTYGGRWQGDRIVLSLGDRIVSVPDSGGAPETLVTRPQSSADLLAHPQLVGGGTAVLYTLRPANGATYDGKIFVQTLPSGSPRLLVEGGSDASLSSSGHLLWIREGTLIAQPFDLNGLQPHGSPMPVVEDIRDTPISGVGMVTMSDTGTLAYVIGETEGPRNLVWVDRKGVESPTGATPHAFTYPRLSPDGTRIAANTNARSDNDVLVWDLLRKIMTRLTPGPEYESYPVWSHDNRWILFGRGKDVVGAADLWRRAADGTGTLERLTETQFGRLVPMQVLDDGRVLLRSGTGPGFGKLFVAPGTPGGKAEPVLPASISNQINGEISPDGRWIAYQSRENSTREEIHVRPFPAADSGHWQISSGGGTRPMWSNSGRELFFITGPPMWLMRVEIQARGTSGPFASSTPAPMLDVSKYDLGTIGRGFHISRGDDRFLMVAPIVSEAARGASIVVVTHWLEELKARVPRK